MRNFVYGMATGALLTMGVTMGATVAESVEHVWGLMHSTWAPTPSGPAMPLSAYEVHRLAAVAAMRDYCNIYFEETEKSDRLATRFRDSQDPDKFEILHRLTESFKSEDCDDLLRRFPDMMKYVDL
ncbi:MULTISPECIES: hypothetical protein [unclassified Rhizobium]|uniref:hypothetical protein n=1 Tax=unclassified Rhizobium TaxID=2613769 RepID=UPI00382D3C9B